MDPNETLRRLRLLTNPNDLSPLTEEEEHDALTEAAELFRALDDWLSRGGFFPYSWGIRAEDAAERDAQSRLDSNWED